MSTIHLHSFLRNKTSTSLLATAIKIEANTFEKLKTNSEFALFDTSLLIMLVKYDHGIM